MKYLILNADDFGLSKIFNAEILKLIKNGLISSTSVLINRITEEQNDQTKELIALKKLQNISIGLHLEFSDNNFETEIQKQYIKFFSVFGFNPNHLDLHKSTFLKESYPFIQKFCKENNMPCRNHNLNSENVARTKNEVLNGTEMSFNELKKSIENFQDGEGYEILFHPGIFDPNCKSSLNKKRGEDVEKIKNVNLLLKNHDIVLINYNDIVENI